LTDIREEASRRRWRDVSAFFRAHWKQLITLIFVLTLTIMLFLNRENIEFLLRGREQYAYLGIFVVSIAGSATLVLPFPTALIIVNAGLVLNPVLVGVVSGIGATIGELTGYLAGYSGRMVIKDTPTYERVVGWMRRWGSWTIFVLALIPNPLFDIAGITAGVLRYPWWKFMLVGMAGRIPKHILYAYSGVLGWNFLTPD
jgi:membrane protein YqaA with SNARE-associated domain